MILEKFWELSSSVYERSRNPFDGAAHNKLYHRVELHSVCTFHGVSVTSHREKLSCSFDEKWFEVNEKTHFYLSTVRCMRDIPAPV